MEGDPNQNQNTKVFWKFKEDLFYWIYGIYELFLVTREKFFNITSVYKIAHNGDF